MKPILEQVFSSEKSSFSVAKYTLPVFDTPYHYHPETELTYIVSGVGKRFVGGMVADFGPDDLVLIGPNIPHCWNSYSALHEKEVEAIVIQFDRDVLGNHFLHLPELAEINMLFEKSNSGVLIKGKTRNDVCDRMKESLNVIGFPKLILLIEILYLISVSNEVELIDNHFYNQKISSIEAERFQKVFTFLIDNFRTEISLKEVADVACLTPTAFCRYFKRITKKTFTEVVTDFRIKHACQLLRATQMPISEICFESGFGNISFFTKCFKSSIQSTPLQYRMLFNSK